MLLLLLGSACARQTAGIIQFAEFMELGSKISVLQGGYTIQRYQTIYKPCIYLVTFILAMIVFSIDIGLLTSVLRTYPKLIFNLD